MIASGNTPNALIRSASDFGYFPMHLVSYVGAKVSNLIDRNDTSIAYEVHKDHQYKVSIDFDILLIEQIVSEFCRTQGFFFEIHGENPNGEPKNCPGKFSFYSDIKNLGALKAQLAIAGIKFRSEQSPIQKGDENYARLTDANPELALYNIDIMHPDASKGGALKSIVYEAVTSTGETPLYVIVIGDSGNDISLAHAVQELVGKGIEAFFIIPGNSNDWDYLINPAKKLLEKTSFGNRLWHSTLPASAAMIEVLVHTGIINCADYTAYLDHPDMLPAIAQQLRAAAQ